MSQERLKDLAMLRIKKEMFDNVDLDTVITDFAYKNACRSLFI